jgi:hypothetical protein
MPSQSTGYCYTHFPVDVMMNGFILSNWNYNDDLDLLPFILLDDSIDTIKDEYNLLTDRLRRRILKASPHARIQRQVGIIEKVERNQRLSSYTILVHHQTYLTMQITTTAAAWRRQWQLGNGGGSGGSMVAVVVAAAWWQHGGGGGSAAAAAA